MKHDIFAIVVLSLALQALPVPALAGWPTSLVPAGAFEAFKEGRRMRSMDDDTLVFLYLSSTKPSDGGEMDLELNLELDSARRARREVARRLSGRRWEAFFEVLEPALKARLRRDLEAATDASGFIDGFLALAKGDAPGAYRRILVDFVLDNTGAILALGPSTAQLVRIAGIMGGGRGPVGILQALLERAGNDASAFLEVFWAMADSGVDALSLQDFIADRVDSLGRLDLSLADIIRLEEGFSWSRHALLKPVGFGLRRARSAGEFMELLEVVVGSFRSNLYQDELDRVFVAHGGDVARLGFSDDQMLRISGHVLRPGTNLALLEGRLDGAGRASGFLDIDLYLPGEYHQDFLRAAGALFIARAGDIMDTGLSVAEIKAMVDTVDSSPEKVAVAFLGAGLDRAGRSEDFFDLFDALVEGPDESYRTLLDAFVAARARDIVALSPSPGQFRRLERNIRKPASAVKLLEAALDGEETTAKVFFSVFDALTTVEKPSVKYADALGDFAIARVGRIMDVGPSAAQLGRLALYVARRPDVGVAILEEALGRARSVGDFADIVDAVAPGMKLGDRIRGDYRNFFVDNLDAVLALPPDSGRAEEMLELGRFVEEPEIGRALERRQRRIGSGCAPAAAALVSPGGAKTIAH